MTESAPLLDDFDENVPHIGEAHTAIHRKKTPANAYFRPVFKILAITTVVISVVTVALLITAYIILEIEPWGHSYVWPWNARRATKVLAIYMSAPIVTSGISSLFNFPILLNVVIDVVLLACIIPRVVDFITEIPDYWWCRQNTYPGPPFPDAKCLHWKLVLTILMGIGAGFTLLICIIYAVQLLLRGVAIYRTKIWKRPLSLVLPQEIDIHFRMRLLPVRQEGGSVEGSGHGPVYLPS